LQEGAEETEMSEMETKTQKLKLGTGKNAVNVHLTVGNNLIYMSASTNDADVNFYLHPLVDMAMLCIENGASINDVCERLKYHKDRDPVKTSSKYVPSATSVPDMIGRYIENRYIKCPIIKRILANGIEPARALDKTGRLYIDWSVEDLKAEANGNSR
jgi:hypothetical protein